MKGLLKAVLVVLAVLLLSGMGGLGGGPDGTVPETDEDVAARVSDRSGVTTELTQFSMDGQVYLSGRRGDGEVTIFFKDLRKVEFGKVVGENVPAELYLKTGASLRLELKKRAVFYGSTGYGAYQVRASDILRIEFPETSR